MKQIKLPGADELPSDVYGMDKQKYRHARHPLPEALRPGPRHTKCNDDNHDNYATWTWY